MNVSEPLSGESRPCRGRVTRLFFVFLIFGSLTSCYSREPRETIPAMALPFNELKDRVAQLRELSLHQDITLSSPEPDAAARELNSLDARDYGPSPIAQVERAYKRIALLAEPTDFAKALADYHRLERMALYDVRQRSVIVGPQAFRLGRAFAQANPRMAQEIPALFGIAQALQEQNFHWDDRLQFIFLEDRRLAFRALARGDATLVALAHASGEKKVPTSVVDIQIIARLGAELEMSGADLPPMLRHKLSFPYREGSQFVLWAYAAKGWQGVNQLYADPPLSTSQILHPERYYIRRENPVRIFPWGLISRMKESALLEQTLGEFSIRIVLSSVRSDKEVAPIASGWQGDHLTVYREGDDLVTAWISSWKDAAHARSFFRAYEEALESHHRVRFDFSADRKENLQAQLPGGRSMVLEVNGSMVLFLDGPPLTRSLQLADGAWRNLETVTEPMRTPFELGQRPPQWSPKIR